MRPQNNTKSRSQSILVFEFYFGVGKFYVWRMTGVHDHVYVMSHKRRKRSEYPTLDTDTLKSTLHLYLMVHISEIQNYLHSAWPCYKSLIKRLIQVFQTESKTAGWEGVQECSWFRRLGSSIATCSTVVLQLLVAVVQSTQVKMDEQKGTSVSAMLEMLLPLKWIQSDFYFVGAVVSHGLFLFNFRWPFSPPNLILANKN